jgi:hypothetical protein
MAINFKQIQEGIIDTINELVGKDCCPDRQLFTSPVIKAKRKGPTPSFPLVVVDNLGTGQYGISSTSAEYFNEEDNWVRETRYKASYIIDVHGGVDDNVLMIAQVIRDTLFRDYGRALLHTKTNAGLLAISSPSFSFNYLNTNYEEVARLVIDFSVTDIFIEDEPDCPSTGVIETIIVDGELFESEDDEDPLETRSTAP